MHSIDIAATTIDHIDDIMIIENLSFKIPWSRDSFVSEITKNAFARYVSAKTGERVIGYGGMWKICDEGHITNIAVHPEFRGDGVGSMLLEKLIDIAKREGIVKMTLEVRKSNFAAQGLYRKYGFKTEGYRKAYYEDNGEDAAIMWKSIT